MRLFAPEQPCLELRIPAAEDAAEWYALFRDTRVMEYLGRPADSLAHYEDMVVRARAGYEREGFCLYTVLADGEVAGFTGAHRWLNDWGPAGEIELAWRLGCACGGWASASICCYSRPQPGVDGSGSTFGDAPAQQLRGATKRLEPAHHRVGHGPVSPGTKPEPAPL